MNYANEYRRGEGKRDEAKMAELGARIEDALKQIEAVNKVIYDIVKETGEDAPPEMIVVNKIDQADPLVLAELRHAVDDAVYVSAVTGEGIPELEARIELFLNSLDAHLVLLVPFTRGDVISRLHEYGTVRSEEYTADGTLIDVRLPQSMARELAEFAVEGEAS